MRIAPPHPPSALSEPSHASATMRRAAEVDEALGARLGVVAIIFLVSLFAVSFPTLSKRVRVLRIPPIVFFVGKHFGTGVILSTAFVHLLQDAFDALADHPAGRFTGLIVLCSLLAIFLVEYISTSYVDTLQSYPSPPSSPPLASSPSSSTITEDQPDIDTSDLAAQGVYTLPASPAPARESTPLLAQTLPRSFRPHHPYRSTTPRSTLAQSQLLPARPSRKAQSEFFPSRRQSYHAHAHAHRGVEADIFSGGHHRHEPRAQHASHVGRRRRSLQAEELAGAFGAGGGRPHPHHPHQCEVDDERQIDGATEGGGEDALEESYDFGPLGHHHHDGGHGHGHGGGGWDEVGEGEVGEGIGRKRVVVGILVLQLGIMIHSLVIGLTLAITSGNGFTSLVFAIIFHQLFEGLSLGIRIAQLPTGEHPHAHPHAHSHPPQHSDTEAHSTTSKTPRARALRFLKPTLAVLFALTTPLGTLAGLLCFASSAPAALTGWMCALSAGMLIYAATVEMLAADFVMDPASWRAGWRRQALALGALLAGVAGMSLVGM
ncbi:Zinc/iron permease [Gloeophyllum trabeum ATCC 11539]|uniref:Zinc/iron permease n=1 Tax=Gloeophyllum trabeum (strain ATCC 11539 / FP-39264 / Madison 617) TaxID=670483 RepID=S7RKQ8_GLOTA|nr:Zinc/iron permease [Gloeophyllum trabeum ATCC 11539]EPQ53254.1 Zinc/iron permease [Gloeophyllum trabeum ATCC 11539]